MPKKKKFSAAGLAQTLKRRKKMLREAAMEAEGKKKGKPKPQEDKMAPPPEKEDEDFEAYLQSLREKRKRGEM